MFFKNCCYTLNNLGCDPGYQIMLLIRKLYFDTKFCVGIFLLWNFTLSTKYCEPGYLMMMLTRKFHPYHQILRRNIVCNNFWPLLLKPPVEINNSLRAQWFWKPCGSSGRTYGKRTDVISPWDLPNPSQKTYVFNGRIYSVKRTEMISP